MIDEELASSVCLVVSGIVTYAVQHSSSPVLLQLLLIDSGITVTVHYAGTPERLARSTPRAETGHGDLQLAETLADTFTVSTSSLGTFAVALLRIHQVPGQTPCSFGGK
ncbi:hypothetical protein ACFQ71_42205 [Streptomyces sp. NPDC056534]|uniref:hypothetical protein n=1 Tax=Streptomyces sp. NPDC056534 TaxID=3345857 RepID=UPI0036964139